MKWLFSHLPEGSAYRRVAGLGMNAAELNRTFDQTRTGNLVRTAFIGVQEFDSAAVAFQCNI